MKGYEIVIARGQCFQAFLGRVHSFHARKITSFKLCCKITKDMQITLEVAVLQKVLPSILKRLKNIFKPMEVPQY